MWKVVGFEPIDEDEITRADEYPEHEQWSSGCKNIIVRVKRGWWWIFLTF